MSEHVCVLRVRVPLFTADGRSTRLNKSTPAPPSVWVFWRLIWRTESLDRGLILVCRFSFVSNWGAYLLRLRPALVYKAGCTCVTLYCSQMGKRLSQRRATCAGGMVIVSECLSKSLNSIRTINLKDYYYLFPGCGVSFIDFLKISIF
jgi:hypothetical protein